MPTCNWPISQTQSLEFQIYNQNTSWNAVSGLYIFAYQSGAHWYAVYVGQADNFANRLPAHERLSEAVQNGATHIHAKVVSQQAQRNQWEKQLIQHLQPLLNVQHR